MLETLNVKAMALLNQIFMAWDLGSFLQNATGTLKTWGGYFIVLIGVVMLIFGVFKAGKALMSKGQGQDNWAIIIILIILGGAFIAGGWTFVETISKGGKKTIEDLGGHTILPMIQSGFPKLF